LFSRIPAFDFEALTWLKEVKVALSWTDITWPVNKDYLFLIFSCWTSILLFRYSWIVIEQWKMNETEQWKKKNQIFLYRRGKTEARQDEFNPLQERRGKGVLEEEGWMINNYLTFTVTRTYLCILLSLSLIGLTASLLLCSFTVNSFPFTSSVGFTIAFHSPIGFPISFPSPYGFGFTIPSKVQ